MTHDLEVIASCLWKEIVKKTFTTERRGGMDKYCPPCDGRKKECPMYTPQKNTIGQEYKENE